MARPRKTADLTRKRASSSAPRRRRGKDSSLEFRNVRVEGGLLSNEMLAKIAANAPTVPGLRPQDYSDRPNARLNELATNAWTELKDYWQDFQERRRELPDDDFGVTLTRSKWLLPLFKKLEMYPDYIHGGVEIDGHEYLITHKVAEPVALYLDSFRQDLEKKDPRNPSNSRMTPHSLMQEFLNQSEPYVWGVVTNGLKFRFLRDNASFTRAAFVEFDLETIMETDDYGNFYLFYLLAHRSRFAKRTLAEELAEESGALSEEEAAQLDSGCWLEKWHNQVQTDGVRALDGLYDGVAAAINYLGAGFLACRSNEELREALATGRDARGNKYDSQDYYHELLRVVYRIIFLLMAEDRGLLFDKARNQDGEAAANFERYMRYYSISRIRELSRKIRGTRHVDLWRQLSLVFRCFNEGKPELGVPQLDSALFSESFTPILQRCTLENIDLLAAVRELTHTRKNNVRQRVDYRNLGAEEIGSVYELLLEQRPEVDTRSRRRSGSFYLQTTAGNERKTTGSYYTPTSLVNSLIETALEPTLKETLEGANDVAERERRLLGMKVCDPACGSGHFLVGAARRLGKRLANIRTGDSELSEPTPAELREAIRDVVANCIYGVDLNEMAVELCKFSLWLETMEPGKALMFLDHRIRCGNSLVGATQRQLDGIDKGNPSDVVPDGAFTPLEGDDKEVCRELKKRNRDAAKGQHWFFGVDGRVDVKGWQAPASAPDFSALPNDDADDYQKRSARYSEYRASEEFLREKTLRDLFCGAFLLEKTKATVEYCVTNDVVVRAKIDPETLDPTLLERNRQVAEEYDAFHWDIEFPEVFGAGSKRGFDVVLGNPPWERVKLQDKEWFAQRAPEIANARNRATRVRMIKNLAETNPELLDDYRHALRRSQTLSSFPRYSGRFPFCGAGDVNTYALFAELDRNLAAPTGRAGFIVPSGIAMDNTTRFFFQDLVQKNAIFTLYDFENRKGLFPAVDSRVKFTLLTTRGEKVATRTKPRMAFFNLSTSDIDEEGRAFTLTGDDFALLNPNTLTCPVFRGVKDLELSKAAYRRVPVLLREKNERQEEANPWDVSFLRMFDMANDSHLFYTRDELEKLGSSLNGNRFLTPDKTEFWPLFEAKMTHHYNHRFGDYSDLPEGSKSTQLPDVPVERYLNPNYTTMPRYWVRDEEVLKRIPNSSAKFLTGWRRIAGSTNERTVIATMTPIVGFGDTESLILFKGERGWPRAWLCNLRRFNKLYPRLPRKKQNWRNASVTFYRQTNPNPPPINLFLPMSLLT
ncbi:MAG: Eco57I restriction-modification methylase domain-containing protein [Thermoguttaceae bacterium]